MTAVEDALEWCQDNPVKPHVYAVLAEMAERAGAVDHAVASIMESEWWLTQLAVETKRAKDAWSANLEHLGNVDNRTGLFHEYKALRDLAHGLGLGFEIAERVALMEIGAGDPS